MNILAVDTSGPSLSVALTHNDQIIFECIQQNGRTHSESLLALIDAALTTGRLLPEAIDCFAVVTGPGSFTGVRIGVATVKGFVQATGKPCIGVNALEALAYGVSLYSGMVCPLQDARAGQVYCAAFSQGTRVLPDAAMRLDDFLDIIKPYGSCCFVGDGALAHRSAIEAQTEGAAVFAPASLMVPRASNVARIAYERRLQTHDGQALQPYYLRAPQAERERLARETAT